MSKRRQEYLDFFRHMEDEHVKSCLGGMAFDDVVWYFHNAVDVDRLFTKDELIEMFPRLLKKQKQNKPSEIGVICYEVGYEAPEILSSGSTYYPRWSGTLLEEAFKEFKKRNNNYLLRLVDDGGNLRKQMYNPESQKWE